MSMFNNYKYPDSGMKYNLTSDCNPGYKKLNVESPYKKFDKAGNLISLSWNENDTFILEDTMDKNIFVESDARIYDNIEGYPTETTSGGCCQKAYNTINWKCWTCYGKHLNKYSWEEIPLIECETGTLRITLKRDLENKKVISNILNFRREIIYSFEGDSVNFEINKEKQPLLVQGQYFLEEILKSENTTQTIKIIPITIL